MSAIVLAALLALPSPDDAGWRLVRYEDGVTLKALDAEGRWGMGEGEIAAPIEKVIEHLINFAMLPRFVPRVARADVLARTASEALVYFKFDLPWPVADRDWTVRYRWTPLDGGRWRMEWSEENKAGPPPEKAVRVETVRGAWELSKMPNGHTWARYRFLVELGGNLPRSVIEQTTWKQPLGTLRGVRKALGVR